MAKLRFSPPDLNSPRGQCAGLATVDSLTGQQVRSSCSFLFTPLSEKQMSAAARSSWWELLPGSLMSWPPAGPSWASKQLVHTFLPPGPGEKSHIPEKWNHLLELVVGPLSCPHLSLRFLSAWRPWAPACSSFRATLTPLPRSPQCRLLPVLSEPRCTLLWASPALVSAVSFQGHSQWIVLSSHGWGCPSLLGLGLLLTSPLHPSTPF